MSRFSRAYPFEGLDPGTGTPFAAIMLLSHPSHLSTGSPLRAEGRLPTINDLGNLGPIDRNFVGRSGQQASFSRWRLIPTMRTVSRSSHSAKMVRGRFLLE